MVKPDTPPEVVAFFRACAARRRREERSCALCGAPLGPVVLKRRYCGPTCRKRAQLQRQRQAQTRQGEPLAHVAATPPVAPAAAVAAPVPLQPGDRVVVVREMPVVPQGATGTLERLVDDGRATVQWDRYPREQRVPLNRLQRAEPPTP
jgi:hypothetical protein